MPLSTASQFFRTDPLDRILRRFCGGRRWPRPQGGELGRGVQTQSQRKVTPTVSRGPHKARHGKKNTWYYCDLHSIITELTPNAAHFIQFGCLVLKDFQTTVTSVWSRTIYLCNKWRILFFHWWNFSICTYSIGPKKRQVWLNITDRYYIWRHFLRSPKDSHFPSTFLSIGSRCLTDREPAWTTSVENCLHQLWLLCRRSNKGDIHTRQEKEQMKLSHFFFWFSLLYGWISAISPFSDFHRHLSFHTPSVPAFTIPTSSWCSVNHQHLQSCNIMLFCRLMPK